jgi:hypothetical protein
LSAAAAAAVSRELSDLQALFEAKCAEANALSDELSVVKQQQQQQQQQQQHQQQQQQQHSTQSRPISSVGVIQALNMQVRHLAPHQIS